MSKINNVNLKNQNGNILVFSIIVLSIVLATALGITAIILQEVKMARAVGNSVISFYAAESGVERLSMWKENLLLSPLLSEGGGCTNKNSLCDLGNGSGYYLSASPPGGGCLADNACIKSVGIYNKTRRGIEINY